MFEVAEEPLADGTRERRPVPAEQATAAPFFPRQPPGAREAMSPPRHVAPESDRAHRAVAIEPVRVSLAPDGEAPRPVAVEGAP